MPEDRSKTIRRIYSRLHQAYSPMHWWPAQGRDEIVIGAILAQNTAWPNVERAVQRLHRFGCLSLQAIDKTPMDDLAELVRPSGTYRIKAQRLKTFSAWLRSRFDLSLDALFASGVEVARRALLGVHGIGPETADAILLYAGKLPTFVVDAYTQRILRRHLVVPAGYTYQQTKHVVECSLSADHSMYNEYHALLVEVGKRHCRPRARCDGCPLESLPHDAAL